MPYMIGGSGNGGRGVETMPGSKGDSAYQIWLELGNTGSERDFINSLRGEPGLQGSNGGNGADGKSAYEIWLNNGNTGTEQDFLESLKGETGQQGEKGEKGTNGLTPYINNSDGNWYLGNENTGVKAQGERGIDGKDGELGKKGDKGEPGIPGENGVKGEPGEKGKDGKSTFQIWLDLGNEGTEQDFIDSLKSEVEIQGERGADGKSAYDIWLELGNLGTKQDFIDSLKGASSSTIEDIDLSSYATKEYIDDKIAGVDFSSIDLSNYVTIDMFNQVFGSLVTSLQSIVGEAL